MTSKLKDRIGVIAGAGMTWVVNSLASNILVASSSSGLRRVGFFDLCIKLSHAVYPGIYAASLATLRTIASYELFCYAIEDLAAANRAFVRRCIIPMSAFFAIFCLLAATSHAQELRTSESVASPTSSISGWWSPENAAARPHLQLSMAELNRFGAEAPLASAVPMSTQTLATQVTSYPLDFGSFGLTNDPQEAGWTALAQGQTLSPESLLGSAQSNYTTWETNLAETRTPVDVNGLSVYPLVQISYGQWTVPVALYISPMRGSDTRW